MDREQLGEMLKSKLLKWPVPGFGRRDISPLDSEMVRIIGPSWPGDGTIILPNCR